VPSGGKTWQLGKPSEQNVSEVEPRTCRARFGLGHDAVPVEALEAVDVEPNFGEFVDTDAVRVATPDGGIVEAGDGAEVLTDKTDEDVDTTPLEPADDEDDTDECEDCAALSELPCFECYMDGKGFDI